MDSLQHSLQLAKLLLCPHNGLDEELCHPRIRYNWSPKFVTSFACEYGTEAAYSVLAGIRQHANVGESKVPPYTMSMKSRAFHSPHRKTPASRSRASVMTRRTATKRSVSPSHEDSRAGDCPGGRRRETSRLKPRCFAHMGHPTPSRDGGLAMTNGRAALRSRGSVTVWPIVPSSNCSVGLMWRREHALMTTVSLRGCPLIQSRQRRCAGYPASGSGGRSMPAEGSTASDSESSSRT